MEIKNELFGFDGDREYVVVSLGLYAGILMEYNREVNIISRKITHQGLEQLLDETLFLNRFIYCGTVVDVGSGNGILGIPIALLNKDKKIILVEPKKKKFIFLEILKEQMKLENVEVYDVSIDEYLKNHKEKSRTLIARGFPRLDVFCQSVKKRMAAEAVLITSENKIKKNQLHLESVRKKTYNVPLREHLKILKILPMEKVSRGKENEKERRNNRHCQSKRRSGQNHHGH
jgi:16S rRNA (guanine527-N7)-methyltransferase